MRLLTIQYDSLNERISFTLNIEVGDEGEKKKLSLMCRFPHEYPSIPTEIFLQSEALSRTNHRKLSDDLHNYILELDRGEICMCYAIQWFQDNADQYFEEVIEVVQTKEPKTDPYFSRRWIYSHHIYSKWKRADIQTHSKQFDLTGFLMPGKPGIIAIEGYRNNVEDFWHRVRRMTWKRIMMKEREDVELNESITVDKCWVFTGFGEKYFEPRQGKGRGGHGDRGLLFQFLEEHGCAHIFSIVFWGRRKIYRS